MWVPWWTDLLITPRGWLESDKNFIFSKCYPEELTASSHYRAGSLPPGVSLVGRSSLYWRPDDSITDPLSTIFVAYYAAVKGAN
jgi:hypothetical protein